jgi:hypothetical protein
LVPVVTFNESGHLARFSSNAVGVRSGSTSTTRMPKARTSSRRYRLVDHIRRKFNGFVA